MTIPKWPPRVDESSPHRAGYAAILGQRAGLRHHRGALRVGSPLLPAYYVPLDDVRAEFLRDEDHPQTGAAGPVAAVLPGRRRSDPPVGRAGLRRRRRQSRRGYWCDSNWDPLRWFEEDEQIYGHPRNPYSRVDALRSHRHVRVELDGAVLADTRSPVLLFETGLPTRYYIDPTDVDFEHLEPTSTQTLCPYKGVTSGYWSVRVGDDGASGPRVDLPLPAAGRRPDRRPGGVLQREARHHRRRCRAAPAAHAVQLARRCEPKSIFKPTAHITRNISHSRLHPSTASLHTAADSNSPLARIGVCLNHVALSRLAKSRRQRLAAGGGDSGRHDEHPRHRGPVRRDRAEEVGREHDADGLHRVRAGAGRVGAVGFQDGLRRAAEARPRHPASGGRDTPGRS